MAHIIIGVLGARNASHFGGQAIDYESFTYAGTADEALLQLDTKYVAWLNGVRSLGEEGLERPCGPSEPYPEWAVAALILHINREMIHHGADIALLRYLYANH